jgi:dolichol-phosphate mannosyltransferase
MVLRFLRFNVVGVLGIGVQVAVLSLLAGALHVHYLVATAVAIELSVLHNFFWHLRWTWAPPDAGRPRNQVFFRCLAFHAGNGLVSMLGSLALMPLFVGQLGLHYVLANLVAIACTGVINFVLGDSMIFRRGHA